MELMLSQGSISTFALGYFVLFGGEFLMELMLSQGSISTLS